MLLLSYSQLDETSPLLQKETQDSFQEETVDIQEENVDIQKETTENFLPQVTEEISRYQGVISGAIPPTTIQEAFLLDGIPEVILLSSVDSLLEEMVGVIHPCQICGVSHLDLLCVMNCMLVKIHLIVLLDITATLETMNLTQIP